MEHHHDLFGLRDAELPRQLGIKHIVAVDDLNFQIMVP
jgi:hypothetical protein